MKNILSLTLALIQMAFCSNAVSGQIEKIRETKEITIAHRDASIPFSYLDDQKRPVGYAMDLCFKIVKALEKELKIPAITASIWPFLPLPEYHPS